MDVRWIYFWWLLEHKQVDKRGEGEGVHLYWLWFVVILWFNKYWKKEIFDLSPHAHTVTPWMWFMLRIPSFLCIKYSSLVFSNAQARHRLFPCFSCLTRTHDIWSIFSCQSHEASSSPLFDSPDPQPRISHKWNVNYQLTILASISHHFLHPAPSLLIFPPICSCIPLSFLVIFRWLT